MAKKEYYLIIDTETTIAGRVADFAAVLTDRKGNNIAQCAILINGVFLKESLFYDNRNATWSKKNAIRKEKEYKNMLNAGTRMLASIHAINRWLEKAARYEPYLTAYNLMFDINSCNKTGIDLTMFQRQFCLWHIAAAKYGRSKKYKKFVLENHFFNNPTKNGNMTYKTNAECIAKFLLNNSTIQEPHTALEDIIYFELPILLRIVNSKGWKKYLNNEYKYDWSNFVVNKNFKVK